MTTTLRLLALALLTASCHRSDPDERDGRTTGDDRSAARESAGAQLRKAIAAMPAVGHPGVASWDALDVSAKERLRTTPVIYLHQSVGQDLEDGAKANGFPFEYYGPNQTELAAGLSGGLFNDVGPIDNGKPMEKLALVERIAKRHRGKLRVMAFSFGYADVRDADLEQVQREYVRVTKAVEATGARMLHITPPLVFDVAENPPKMKMREWMLRTYAGSPIFDLQDIESLDGGKRCEVGGVWRICQANRSSAACPSLGQGIDTDGQGHLCSTQAAVFAKAMLFAMERAAS
jgi:hypothetical protein